MVGVEGVGEVRLRGECSESLSPIALTVERLREIVNATVKVDESSFIVADLLLEEDAWINEDLSDFLEDVRVVRVTATFHVEEEPPPAVSLFGIEVTPHVADSVATWKFATVLRDLEPLWGVIGDKEFECDLASTVIEGVDVTVQYDPFPEPLSRDTVVFEVSSQPQSSERPTKPQRDFRAELAQEVDEMVSVLSLEMAKTMDEHKWLFVLNSTGVYHCFKERLKPRIQRLMRPRFRPDDRFLNQVYTEVMGVAVAALNRRFREPPAEVQHYDPSSQQQYRPSHPESVLSRAARGVLDPESIDPAELSGREYAALMLETDRDVVVEDDALRAVQLDAKGEKRAARKALNACGRCRLTVLLELCEWLAKRGMRKTLGRAIRMLEAAEVRAREHARLLRDARRLLTPPHVRAKMAYFQAIRDFPHGDVDRACLLAPDDPDVWILKGLCGSPTALARGLALSANPPLWLYQRVRDTWSHLALDVAIQSCAKFPENPEPWRGTGKVLLDLGLYEDAERCLEESNALDKDDGETWALLALANLGQYKLSDPERIEVADRLVSHALALGFRDHHILTRLGHAFEAVDKLKLATALFSRAEDRDNLSRLLARQRGGLG